MPMYDLYLLCSAFRHLYTADVGIIWRHFPSRSSPHPVGLSLVCLLSIRLPLFNPSAGFTFGTRQIIHVLVVHSYYLQLMLYGASLFLHDAVVMIKFGRGLILARHIVVAW